MIRESVVEWIRVETAHSPMLCMLLVDFGCSDDAMDGSYSAGAKNLALPNAACPGSDAFWSSGYWSVPAK